MAGLAAFGDLTELLGGARRSLLDTGLNPLNSGDPTLMIPNYMERSHRKVRSVSRSARGEACLLHGRHRRGRA